MNLYNDKHIDKRTSGPGDLVTQVFQSGAIELENDKGERFKANVQRVKAYLGVPEEVKIVEEFKLDECHIVLVCAGKSWPKDLEAGSGGALHGHPHGPWCTSQATPRSVEVTKNLQEATANDTIRFKEELGTTGPRRKSAPTHTSPPPPLTQSEDDAESSSSEVQINTEVEDHSPRATRSRTARAILQHTPSQPKEKGSGSGSGKESGSGFRSGKEYDSASQYSAVEPQSEVGVETEMGA
ncbi:hypothetical protein KY290_005072 [Solanum tuberosum]|uniref:Integrase core domain containing protein n=1 Tax=Solanum tuberosum TaxID=4113 RepID=A0ABQ7WD23_SOLTU|nr:hypothetical protein KY285_004975 [Solanum tuberosum]KAH0778645.1 hypothetical protein KY290_005072 [Solanum tuberosum]